MSISNSIKREILRFGNPAVVETNGESVRTRAFVEPLRYRNRLYFGSDFKDLGINRREKYLYIGTPCCPLTENKSFVTAHGQKYIVRRCETYRVGEIPIYIWAVMIKTGEETEDDYGTDQ